MVAAIIIQRSAHVSPTPIKCFNVLAEVRFNSGRFSALIGSKDIQNSLRDTRPGSGFHFPWQVFWLMVIGLDVLAFPGISQWRLVSTPYHTQLRVQPRTYPLMGTAHRVPYYASAFGF